IKALGNIKLAGAHFATMFMLAGHYAFYAYFAPFLESTMHLSQTWISICYFLFGIAAVGGGALGGMLADKLGSRKAILSVISVFNCHDAMGNVELEYCATATKLYY